MPSSTAPRREPPIQRPALRAGAPGTRLASPGLLAVVGALALAGTVVLADGAAGQIMTGTVVDAETGFPVAGAMVSALDGEEQERLAVVTDSVGRFALPLDPGPYSFQVRHIAYETLWTEPLELDSRTQLTVEIRLGPRPVAMEPLVVQVRRTVSRSEMLFHRRLATQRAMGLGRFITRDEIDNAAAISINHLLTRELGLELASVGGTDVVVIRSRGTTCMPTLFIDGARVTSDPQFPLDLSHLFSPSSIEGIEIYRRSIHAPAELGLVGTGCGAIAVWTRSDLEGRPHTWGRLAFAAAWVAAFFLVVR
jgi:hypothetical protein